MTDFGFPVGPLALSDEVGLDVGVHVAEVLARAFPERFSPAPALARMVAAGRLGRKAGCGFYDYTGKHKQPAAEVYAFRDAPPTSVPPALIQRRLVYQLINECVRCMDGGVLHTPRDGDIGAVMGFGFPAYLGGPFRYADSIGAGNVVAELRRMESVYGNHLAPAGLLVHMAERGERFY
jgi:3-hydroxyacyl-CoA dehydrogenase / enoyl-CoA hydratase / 3-hydroxybutyryl-CoA epimerase